MPRNEAKVRIIQLAPMVTGSVSKETGLVSAAESPGPNYYVKAIELYIAIVDE